MLQVACILFGIDRMKTNLSLNLNICKTARKLEENSSQKISFYFSSHLYCFIRETVCAF